MVIVTIVLVFYALKIAGFFILSIRSRFRRCGKEAAGSGTAGLSVDIILPMYNEDKVIVKTIINLLDITYRDLNIIVVDDGSTDGSLGLVNAAFKDHPRVTILSQVNSGKSFALNAGIKRSQSDIVLCIDADTQVRPDVIDRILPYFSDEKVAAVSGYLKVGNRENLLTNVQYVEYITNENFERGVLERFNGIIVIPGAVGAFRRSVVMALGGYARDVLTEDGDITLKILCENYTIKNAPGAIGYTEAPTKLKMFFRQRVRWKVGAIQVLAKYQRTLLAHPNKLLAYVIIPYKWLYGVLLPVLVPFLDYIFIYDTFFLHRYAILPYYFAFVLADFFICAMVLVQQKEPLFLFFLPIQRFLLRSLTLVSYLHIPFKFFKGSLFEWKKILRYGSVKMD